jgi:cytochrome c-type biogenesis protein CcmH/NrfG
VAGAAVVLFGVGVALQQFLQPPSMRVAGKPSVASAHEHDDSDPQIVALRKELEANPEDLTKLRIFAGVLGDKIRKERPASQTVAFEAIDVLGRILHLVPNDPEALVLMADVSFEQQAFTKALEFYERYLKLEPDDLGARSRYASTLTFMSRFDDAINELNRVLAKEPKNFPALAYVAITYHQKGDVKKARQFGEKALQLAPSEEARARFAGFIKMLNEAEAGGGNKSPVAAVSASNKSFEEVAPIQKGVEGVVAAVRANPVAGPKFVTHEVSPKGVLKLTFKDFPMQMMPPFAKEKFFANVRKSVEAASAEELAKIEFVDLATGSTMESLTLK